MGHPDLSLRGPLLALALLLAAPAPAAATRTARADDGTRFVVDGARVRVTLGEEVRVGPRARVRVRCGRTGEALRRTGVSEPRRIRRRAFTVALSRDAESVAEWCQLRSDSLRAADVTAAQLDAPPEPPPDPLGEGPGVRVARAEEGGARFLLRGSVLTVELEEPFGDDRLVFLGAFTPGEDERRVGYRRVAIRASQRSVTVDLGRDASPAGFLLVEPDGDSDLFTAEL